MTKQEAIRYICKKCLFFQNCPLANEHHPYLDIQSVEGDEVKFKCLCIVPTDWLDK